MLAPVRFVRCPFNDGASIGRMCILLSVQALDCSTLPLSASKGETIIIQSFDLSGDVWS